MSNPFANEAETPPPDPTLVLLSLLSASLAPTDLKNMLTVGKDYASVPAPQREWQQAALTLALLRELRGLRADLSSMGSTMIEGFKGIYTNQVAVQKAIVSAGNGDELAKLHRTLSAHHKKLVSGLTEMAGTQVDIEDALQKAVDLLTSGMESAMESRADLHQAVHDDEDEPNARNEDESNEDESNVDADDVIEEVVSEEDA